MRVLNKASITFFIINDYNKSPVLNVDITCNNKKIAYSKKNDGYYTFMNLEKGHYKFDIHSKQFNKASYEIDLEGIEPIKINCCLKYAADSSELLNLNRIIFHFKDGDNIIKETDVEIKLETKVPFLRLIDNINVGNNLVKINSDYDKRLLFQNYSCGKKLDNIFLFNSYDHNTNLYKNFYKFKNNIEEGEILNPIWNNVTDKYGRVALPINRIFFIKAKSELSVYILNKKFKVIVNSNKVKDIIIDISDKKGT